MSSKGRLLAAFATLSLAFAACGGTASPAAETPGSTAPAASSAPSSSDPAPVTTPAAVATAGTTGADISGAATALADLDSYHLLITMKTQGLDEGAFAMFGDGMEMEGTIIFRPTKAADMSISMGAAAQKLAMKYRVIGDKAWVSMGDSWMESPEADAQSMIDSFSADQMLGSFGGVGGLTAVGDETKNGVATTHYTAAADAVGQAVGSSIGLADAKWSMDFWVAKEGGYAVSYAIAGKNASGSFEMNLDVTDINSASNVVEVPTVGS